MTHSAKIRHLHSEDGKEDASTIESKKTFTAYLRYDSKIINILSILIAIPVLLAGYRWLRITISFIGWFQGVIVSLWFCSFFWTREWEELWTIFGISIGITLFGIIIGISFEIN